MLIATLRHSLPLVGARDSDGTTHARAPEPAVAARVLRKVLLVIVLGVIERRGRRDLSRDIAVICFVQPLLELRTRLLGGVRLRRVVCIDGRAILRADVVSLAHALR